MTPRHMKNDKKDKLCPRCHSRVGILRDLTVGRGLVVLGLDCPSCGHGWTIHRGLVQPNWSEQVAQLAGQAAGD